MSKTSRAVLALTVFTAIAAVCALIVITALRNPVSGRVQAYAATFSDVSGLFVDDDVRISGVQVGKVTGVRLDGRHAVVDFTVLDDRPVYDGTIAAVRYQNLLGQRYVELVPPAKPGQRLAAGAKIGLSDTVPSFDVAKLFNGFRPIFRTIDPAQFNQFGENLLRLIQGDESGIGPVLRDLDTITEYAVDRQKVFVVLIHNLSEISHDLTGKSQQAFRLIDTLTDVLQKLAYKSEDFRTAVDQTLPFMRDTVMVLQYTERIIEGSNRPLYDLISRMIPQTPAFIAGLSLVPSLVGELRDRLVGEDLAKPTYTCSNGVVQLPGIGEVSFAEQNLVVCDGVR